MESQWFRVQAEDGTEVGIIWTDDEGIVGFLPNPDVDAESSWPALVESLPSNESAFEILRSFAGGPPIEAGDLADYPTSPTPPTSQPEDTRAVDSYGITINDDGVVLELVRTTSEGTYIRDGGDWALVDPNATEEDYPTVYDQRWEDVQEDILDIYDKSTEEEDILNEEDVEDFFIV